MIKPQCCTGSSEKQTAIKTVDNLKSKFILESDEISVSVGADQYVWSDFFITVL